MKHQNVALTFQKEEGYKIPSTRYKHIIPIASTPITVKQITFSHRANWRKKFSR